MHRVEWSAAAHEDVSALFDYVAEHDSLWDAAKLCERVLNSTDKLAEFPRLYEAAPVRRGRAPDQSGRAACALRGGRPGTNRSRPGRCRPAAEPAPDQGRAMTPRQQLRSPCFSAGSSQGAQ